MPITLTRGQLAPIQDFESEICERLTDGRADSFILVVPTRRRIRQLQREFLEVVPLKAAAAFHLCTLDMLASKLYAVSGSPRRVVAGAIRSLLFERAIQKCDLGYFQPHVPSPTGKLKLPRGTFRRLSEVVNGLKEDGVYPHVLRDEIERTEMSEKAKLTDLYNIYSFYEQELGERFTDTGGIFKDLNSSLNFGNVTPVFRTAFPNVDTLFISGFGGFARPEVNLINTFSLAEGVSTFISLDFYRRNRQLFGHLEENYVRLVGRGFIPMRDDGRQAQNENADLATRSPEPRSQFPAPNVKSAFTQHIQRYLFNRQTEREAKSPQFKDRITLVAAKNRFEEIERIAKLIKHIISQNPQRDFSKICVATYRTENYTPLVREVFARYGIPANITDRYPLSKSPLVVSIIALLGVIQNDFRRRDVMRALVSPYFHFAGRDGTAVDVSNLYLISTNLKILVGRKRWLERIERRLQAVNNRLGGTDDELELEQLTIERNRLEKGKADIQYLWDLLKAFDRRMTPREFKDRLLALLESLGVRRNILKLRRTLAREDELEKDARAYCAFVNLLDSLLDLFEFQALTEKSQRLEFYVDQLKTAISETRYNIRQKFGYGVYVTAIEETRGLDFDIMFLAGLVDGEFPSVYQPEVFLSRELRKNEERHLLEERHLFYQAITNFSEHLYLTYPKTDRELELVRSTFLDGLLDIIEVEEKEDAELQQAILCEDDLFKRYGRSYRLSGYKGLCVPDEMRRRLEHIEHAIGVEQSRLGRHDKVEYEGIIANELTRDDVKMELAKFKDKVYSVSQLETYGKCPFRFFANRVLGLQAVEEVEEGLTPIERGNLYHEILFEFYVARRTAGKKPIHICDDHEYQEALSELLAIARRRIEEFDVNHPFWTLDIEQMTGEETRRKGILPAFLESERARDFIVEPTYFEVSFGERTGYRKNRDPELSVEQPVQVGGIKMRGKVDRIEVGEHIFTICDYKTGKYIPSINDINEGMSLQIPIYLYALEEVLRQRLGKEMKGVAGLYHRLQTPHQVKLGLGNAEYRDTAFTSGRSMQLLPDDAALHEVIQHAVQLVNKYAEDITRGRFSLTEHNPDKVCPHCDYQKICRIQVVKWIGEAKNEE